MDKERWGGQGGVAWTGSGWVDKGGSAGQAGVVDSVGVLDKEWGGQGAGGQGGGGQGKRWTRRGVNKVGLDKEGVGQGGGWTRKGVDKGGLNKVGWTRGGGREVDKEGVLEKEGVGQ